MLKISKRDGNVRNSQNSEKKQAKSLHNIFCKNINFNTSLSNCERPKDFIRASDTYLRYVSISWSSCRVARVWVRSHLSVLQKLRILYLWTNDGPN